LENALIIFIKNPGLGKAKTRLAATLGKEKALEIYLKLLEHTREIALKHIQDQNPDLGQKMFSAFMLLKSLGKKKVVIIGSDCLELTSAISNKAFELLEEKDTIIGPAKDGGYYSIGFNFERLGLKAENLLKQTFLNKAWSHANVCIEAKNGFDSNGISYATLPTLSDVDVAEDVLGLLELKPVLVNHKEIK
jgi:glycosyltransferase A (GT-A) superfamily protein (DUF2064 family)